MGNERRELALKHDTGLTGGVLRGADLDGLGITLPERNLSGSRGDMECKKHHHHSDEHGRLERGHHFDAYGLQE